jgi:RNA polymerase sigma-70 factor (ECF subfamily)
MATLSYTVADRAETSNERIFEREFIPLMHAVTTFAYRLTGDWEASNDLVQETYLKAWRFLDRYTEGTNAKAWIFRICQNAFINEYRSRKSRPYKVDFEDIVVYHNEDDPMSSRYANLNTGHAPESLGDEVTLALGRLTEKYRTVVLLDLEDFTYEEIAAILGIPIGTVRSRLHRARLELANMLRDYANDRGYGIQDEEGNVQESDNNQDEVKSTRREDVDTPLSE